jgi:type VI secretion system secreted protein VgrG
MLNDKESPFTLTLAEGLLCLPVVRFSGEEALNRPFRFEIEAIGLTPLVPPERLLHQPAHLRLDAANVIHGLIDSVSCEHRASHRISYRLTLVPQITRLGQNLTRRVFVHASVPQILEQLLVEHDLPRDSYRIELSTGHYPPRPFCIQYEESDLALLQRLCEEEGIHYHFEQRPDGHVAVFSDDSLSLPQEPVLLTFATDEAPASPGVSAMFQRHDTVQTNVSQSIGDRNRGQRVHTGEAANQSVAPSIPPAPSSAQRHAEQRTRRDLQRQRCQMRSVHGRSDCTGLSSGHLLQLSGHPINAFNEQWLITGLRHHGQHPSILEPAFTQHLYHNDFVALPWSTDFRPPLKQPRPTIPGYHPALVLGAHGSPATLDDQGRIGVRLWPAHTSETEEGIWLPIALTHFNGRISSHQLPRAGSEVWVSFLDSDPDRPILCLDTRRPPPRRDTPPSHNSSLLLDWLLDSTEP